MSGLLGVLTGPDGLAGRAATPVAVPVPAAGGVHAATVIPAPAPGMPAVSAPATAGNALAPAVAAHAGHAGGPATPAALLVGAGASAGLALAAVTAVAVTWARRRRRPVLDAAHVADDRVRYWAGQATPPPGHEHLVGVAASGAAALEEFARLTSDYREGRR